MLQKFLAKKTGCLWQVRVVDQPDAAKTLYEQSLAKQNRYVKAAENLPFIQAARSHLGQDVVLSLKESDAWTEDMT
jgi:hypothetical protein